MIEGVGTRAQAATVSAMLEPRGSFIAIEDDDANVDDAEGGGVKVKGEGEEEEEKVEGGSIVDSRLYAGLYVVVDAIVVVVVGVEDEAVEEDVEVEEEDDVWL